MLTKRVTLALLAAALLASLIAAGAESTPNAAPALQPVPTAGTTFFTSQVSYTPLQQPDRLPQEVTGIVVDRAGVGLRGIQMRATAPNFQAVTATTEGGVFQFSLNAGTYAVQPTTLPSEPTSITVDGRRRIRVEFRERSAVLTPTTLTPTPTPTAVALPTAPPAPPPTATRTPLPTGTPTPLPTLAIGSPVVVPLFPPTGTATPRRPTPTPPPKGSPTPFNVTPWAYAFLAGIAFAVVLFGIWLLVSLLRR